MPVKLGELHWAEIVANDFGYEPILRDDPTPPEGCEVIYDQVNLLLLDLDSEGAVVWFVEVLRMFRTLIAIDRIHIYPSRNNVHVIIVMPEAHEFQSRMAWQIALGSDPRRSLLATLEGPRGNILFRPIGPHGFRKPVEVPKDLPL